MHPLPNLSHLPHDSASNAAEVHLTLALVQLRHARRLTRRSIINDGSGTSIVVTWNSAPRCGRADVGRGGGGEVGRKIRDGQRPFRPSMVSPLMIPGIQGFYHYFRPSAKSWGYLSDFPSLPTFFFLLAAQDNSKTRSYGIVDDHAIIIISEPR